MKHLTSLLMFLFILLGGCSSNIEYLPTQEEALQNGLKQEKLGKEQILAIEDFYGESIIFFEKFGGLGVASIPKTTKGYFWFRNSSLVDFESESSDYLTGGSEHKLYNGQKVFILKGKIFDDTIQKVNLIEKLSGTQKIIWSKKNNKTKFYYSILNGKSSNYEIEVLSQK